MEVGRSQTGRSMPVQGGSGRAGFHRVSLELSAVTCRFRPAVFLLAALVGFFGPLHIEAQTGNNLDVQVVMEPGQEFAPGWILASPRFSSNLTYPIIVDDQGVLRYNALHPYQGFNFDQNANGELSWFSTTLTRWHRLDSTLNFAGAIEFDGADVDYHDLEIREDGSRLLMGKEILTVDISDSALVGDEPTRAVIDCILQEQDPAGNITWTWRATDHIPPTWCTHCNWASNLLDAYHHNAFETQENGDILLCLRNMDLVVLIDHDTGESVWNLGGPFSDFTFVDDHGAFAQQHDAQILPGDRLLLFDNATGSEPLVSRGVEYQLNVEAGTATVVEEWLHPDGNFASSQGSIQRLEDGGTLISWGTAGSNQFFGGMITEYGPAGDLRGSIYYPGNHYSYRARKVPQGALPLHIGCTDPTACNYDAQAVVEADCVTVGSACDDGNACTLGDQVMADCSCLGESLPVGPDDDLCLDPVAVNYNPCSTLPFDDGSCQYLVPFRVDATGWSPVPSTMSLSIAGGEALQLQQGGFGTWHGTLLVGSGVVSYSFLADGVSDGLMRTLDLSYPTPWDGGEVRACFGLDATACPGCTDPDDASFSPFALDDILCGAGPIGCTEPAAVNYDPAAFFDDGSCSFSTVDDCPQDLTGDGLIGVADVLDLLTYFGSVCN